ncbi:MAG TPA: Ldh family oxidoreductase [Cyclobacteriaceae bacterium]|nr:Ldh family oxidoreductase [Cyclobacteriaceae bacterium]
MDTNSNQKFQPEYLLNFTIEVFTYFGIPKDHATLAAKILALSDIRGIDSHGVARLYSYVGLLSEGLINPNPKISIAREKKSVATVDGDNGLGLVVGHYANEMAMDKAEKHGSGWVSVCNSNHYGIAGYYSLEALKRDMIGWSMTNTTKLVAPLWGAERMLGTNPIAIAFPGYKEPPVVIDLATSAAAYGKIEIAKRQKEEVPEGWIADKDGNLSTQPEDMINGGALLPLGSTRALGGHKGYALASMVDILTAVLSGANWGPFAPPFALRQEIPTRSVGKGIGHFFGAMEIDGFMDVIEFKKRIDEWISVMRNTKPAKGIEAVLIPGDPEHQEEIKRKKEGIPLNATVISDLKAISIHTGIPFSGH